MDQQELRSIDAPVAVGVAFLVPVGATVVLPIQVLGVLVATVTTVMMMLRVVPLSLLVQLMGRRGSVYPVSPNRCVINQSYFSSTRLSRAIGRADDGYLYSAGGPCQSSIP